jgi:HD-like signal output (HDOD) protein
MVTSLDEILALAEHAEISSMGIVVNRIVEVIKSPKSNAMELKALIEIDPALSAVILRRANSAFYGLKRKLTNILDAIICLGFDTVKELTLSQKIGQLFKKDALTFGYSRQLLWIHSLGVALAGKLIYRREYRMRGDDIYTAGILHDLGILILDQYLGQDYAPVLERVAGGQNLHEAEQALLGYSHTELGRRLLESWHLPEEFSQAIVWAEQPRLASGEGAKLAKTLYLCNVACQSRGMGYNEAPRGDNALYQESLKELKLSEMALKVIMDDAKLEINKMKEDGWFN